MVTSRIGMFLFKLSPNYAWKCFGMRIHAAEIKWPVGRRQDIIQLSFDITLLSPIRCRSRIWSTLWGRKLLTWWSCLNKVCYQQPGSRAKSRVPEAFGFLRLKYAFSHILETLFLSHLHLTYIYIYFKTNNFQHVLSEKWYAKQNEVRKFLNLNYEK